MIRADTLVCLIGNRAAEVRHEQRAVDQSATQEWLFNCYIHGKKAIMSMARLTISILALAIALYILVPQLSWGEDRPTLTAWSAACDCGFHALLVLKETDK